MQQITIGTKNQIVIPKEIRRKIKAFKPGKKVFVYPINEETVGIKIADKSWAERTAGIMKEEWKAIDPIGELEKMRNEW